MALLGASDGVEQDKALGYSYPIEAAIRGSEEISTECRVGWYWEPGLSDWEGGRLFQLGERRDCGAAGGVAPEIVLRREVDACFEA